MGTGRVKPPTSANFAKFCWGSDRVPHGFEGSWIVGMDKQPAAGNIKNFTCAVTGLSEEEVDQLSKEDGDDLWNKMVGPENAAFGVIVHVKTHHKAIKKAKTEGAVFTVHTWRPLTEAEAAECAQAEAT